MTSSPQLRSPLKKKFFLRGLTLVVVFFVSAGFILYTQSLTRKLKREDDRISQAVQVAGELDSGTITSSLLLHNYTEKQEPQDLLGIKTNRALVDENRRKIKTLLTSPQTLQTLATYEKILPTRRQFTDQIIALANQKNSTSASVINSLHTQREILDTQTRKLLSDIVVSEKEELAEIIAQDAYVQSLIFHGTILLLSVDLLIVVILMVTTYRMLLPPIMALTQLASAIKEGHYSQANPVDTNDELGFLGQIMAEMAQEIQKRTSSLEENNQELKKITNITMDRELKMIKLKEEITRLKS